MLLLLYLAILPIPSIIVTMLAATLDGPLSRAFGQSGYTNGATPSGSQSSSQNHPLAGLLGGGTSGGTKLIPIKNGKGESDGGSSNDHVAQIDLTPLSPLSSSSQARCTTDLC